MQMARVNNQLMQGMSGKLGPLVFRNRNGKTFVAAAPAQNRKGAGTQAQELTRKRFLLAVEYAKKAIRDLGLPAAYQSAAKKAQTAYNVAFRDAFHPPEILEVQTFDYLGKPGDPIHIKVRDDFQVESVRVTICTEDGEILEGGRAAPGLGNLWWEYRVTTPNPGVPSSVLRITVCDLPKNSTSTVIHLSPKSLKND